MRVESRCYPRSDGEFAERVARVVERLEGQAGTAAGLVDLVRGELEPDYPFLRVRLQEPLATLGPSPVVMYVYRDGRPLDCSS
jgi:hypothetical protein